MVKRAYKWVWTARIEKDSLIALQELASNLGFIVNTPGGFHGDPSPPAMLDALAAAYRADSGPVIDAMRAIGVMAAEATEEPAGD